MEFVPKLPHLLWSRWWCDPSLCKGEGRAVQEEGGGKEGGRSWGKDGWVYGEGEGEGEGGQRGTWRGMRVIVNIAE